MELGNGQEPHPRPRSRLHDIRHLGIGPVQLQRRVPFHNGRFEPRLVPGEEDVRTGLEDERVVRLEGI